VDIVVKGRNVEVPDHYRVHVADKLAKIERYDHKLIRVDVELFHERNPRQSDHCQRVEITCVSRGPVVRAEACAKDFYSALDAAIAKLDTRLRRAADRRRVHRGRHAPVSVAAATAGLPVADLASAPLATLTRPSKVEDLDPAAFDNSGDGSWDHAHGAVEDYDDDQPWHIAREKVHPSAPMTVDDALFQMELVGHDFYLFLNKESGRPSVVYRRKGYDYGIIALGE
jgi:ribosomal subunit interface protein